MASFQIKAGAEAHAHIPQGPQASDLPKVRQGGFAAHCMPKLRILQGRASERRTPQTHQERAQVQREGTESTEPWQVGIWHDLLQCSLCTSGILDQKKET